MAGEGEFPKQDGDVLYASEINFLRRFVLYAESEFGGDGSDGAFNPTTDTTISGTKKYTSFTIPSGVTVTVSPYAIIKVTGDVLIEGTLTASGTSAFPFATIGGAPQTEIMSGSSESWILASGYTAVSHNGMYVPGFAGGLNDNIRKKLISHARGWFVGAAAYYKRGGGAILFEVLGGFTNNGTISAAGSGAPSGGGIVGIASLGDIINNGTIDTSGKSASGSSYYYGGGNGAVALITAGSITEGTITGDAAQIRLANQDVNFVKRPWMFGD